MTNPAIRAGIDAARAIGWPDHEILAHISNRPTPEQLAEMRASTTGQRPAKAMSNLIQSILQEPTDD